MLLVALAMFFALTLLMTYQLMTYQMVKHPPMGEVREATFQRRARQVTHARWILFGLVCLMAMVAGYTGHILVAWLVILSWGCVSILLRGLAWSLKYWAKVSPDVPLPVAFDPTWDDPKPKTKS
jgi:hypothetical protein